MRWLRRGPDQEAINTRAIDVEGYLRVRGGDRTMEEIKDFVQMPDDHRRVTQLALQQCVDNRTVLTKVRVEPASSEAVHQYGRHVMYLNEGLMATPPIITPREHHQTLYYVENDGYDDAGLINSPPGEYIGV